MLSSVCEAFPNVLAEAMACGVPCVATDVGDSSLIVGSTGWLVPVKDPRALAESIALALREPQPQHEHRRQLARARIVSLFSINTMINKYMQLYSDLVEQKCVG